MKMKTATLFTALFFALAVSIFGQSRCLSSEEAKKVIESIKASPPATENKKVRAELLEMQEAHEKLNSKIAVDTEKNQNLIPEANQMGIKHLTRVCQIIKENGWLTKEALGGDDGFGAFIYLITNNKDIQAQQELLPVLVEAA